MHGATIKIVF